jgi:VanZ family protein
MKSFLGLSREWLQYPYHFSAFFILSVLFYGCLSSSSNRSGRSVVFPLVGCALVSLCSEWLQLYVPTRTPAVRDLMLDQSGAILAVAVVRYFFR